MKLLDNLTKDRIKSLGLRSLRDSISPNRTYILLKQGSRLLIVDSISYDKVKDFSDYVEIEEGKFLKTPDGIFEIIKNLPDKWLVQGDEELITILKPEPENRETSDEVEEPEYVEEKERPLYPLNKPIHITNSILVNPPYSTMNRRLWNKALGMTLKSYDKVLPYKVLSIYKQLKSKGL